MKVRATKTDLHELGAYEAAKSICNGDISSEELVRACLDQINTNEPKIKAWEYLDAQNAIAQARALDKGPRIGALHGIPIGVKDLIDTSDMPTSYGSKIYANWQPLKDAESVAQLRKAGAVIMGKTVTTEFATFKAPVTRNPHNFDRTPGGSSSGSAAAVAAKMVPLALGTQTAGSVIRPAAFCGVFGFKPSFGFVSTKGVKQISEQLDTVGVLARSLEDIALLVSCLRDSGNIRFNKYSKHPRVGLFRGPYWEQLELSSRVAIEKIWSCFGSSDSLVIESERPLCFKELTEAQHILMSSDIAKALKFEFEEHTNQLSEGLRHLIEDGLTLSVPKIQAAYDISVRARNSVSKLFEDCEILITPSALGEAPGIETTGDPVLNRAWTLLHLPCLNIPIGFGSSGLPISIQLVGRPHSEESLIESAFALQKKFLEPT